MLAAFYEKHGTARDVLRVGEVPTPSPGPGEVRVRLATSGVNPSDVKTRAGARPLLGPIVVPHSDGAGVIDAVGQGVPTRRVGEPVWIWNGQWKRPFGTAAQFIALPSEQAVALPAGTDVAAGACLGIPALTAWQAIRLAGAEPGRTLLVAGGAGAVGHYAIQVAKARGARVLTSVSGAAKAAHARAAGADATIDRKAEDVAARVMQLTDGQGVDAVVELDLAVNAPLLPGTLRPHGVCVVYGTGAGTVTIPAPWLLGNNVAIKFMIVYELSREDRAAALAGVKALLETGRLQHAVGRRLPLGEVALAHELVEQAAVLGNVVLDIE